MLQMLQFQESASGVPQTRSRPWKAASRKPLPTAANAVTFGQPLIDNQVIHFRLAELQTEIEALRALTYQACELYIAGKDVDQTRLMAKLKTGRLGREVTDGCLRYWGGMGFMWDNPVSRTHTAMYAWSPSGRRR